LLPHQAYVTSIVLTDRRRRYILADEVGLGKTIEAGVVIFDLFMRKPEARGFVFTPGTFTPQWLCGLFTGFAGQGFRLLDLYSKKAINLSQWRKVICSTTIASQDLYDELANTKWDMVVVDEVHHLLEAPLLYVLVETFSRNCRDLLLLSA